MINIMIDTVEKITNSFLEKKGYFFLARLSLKVGKDLTKISLQEIRDPKTLERIRGAAIDLGMDREEFNQIINSVRVFV